MKSQNPNLNERTGPTLKDIGEHLGRQDATLERHSLILEGDGNGRVGVVRKLDAMGYRLETIERGQKRNSRLLWAILSAVLAAVVERTVSSVHLSFAEPAARAAIISGK
jgi:hypothetical protein